MWKGSRFSHSRGHLFRSRRSLRAGSSVYKKWQALLRASYFMGGAMIDTEVRRAMRAARWDLLYKAPINLMRTSRRWSLLP